MGPTPTIGLAMGVPMWPRADGGWDPWLVVTLAIALVLVPRLLRRSWSIPLLAASVVGAVGLATAVEVWGIPTGAAVGVVLGLCLSGVAAVRRRRGPSV